MSHDDIARKLNRSQTTISREIRRNRGKKGYRYQQAEHLTREQHSIKNKAIKLTAQVILLVEQYIKKDWSPEQICGCLYRLVEKRQAT